MILLGAPAMATAADIEWSEEQASAWTGELRGARGCIRMFPYVYARPYEVQIAAFGVFGERRTFRTKGEAQAWIEAVLVRLANRP